MEPNQMSLLKKQLKIAEQCQNKPDLVKSLKDKIKTLQEGVVQK